MAAGAVAVAAYCDVAWGEPHASLHPVVAMGRYLGAAGRWVLRRPSARAQCIAGMLAWNAGALVATVVAVALAQWAGKLGPLGGALVVGVLLKPMGAWRVLRDEVGAVESALAESLEAGRERVSRLVSRDVAALSATQVRAAAISTLAENLNDSVVAPLWWFACLGLPGAAVYRFANTADAMWGYRGRWEWAGKWAARTDDVLSWWPARLTGVFLLLASRRRIGWRRLHEEAARTPSPNGGWPMGTMALALGVRLEKPGVYVLNEEGRPPEPADLRHALHLARAAALAAAVLHALLAGAVAEWVRG